MRGLVLLVLWLLVLPADAAPAGSQGKGDPEILLLTVLRSSDPAYVLELLNPVTYGDTMQRTYRSDIPAVAGDRVWQVRVLEGNTAWVATGNRVTRLTVPLVRSSRHGPEPWVGLEQDRQGEGFHVHAERQGDEFVLRLDWYAGVWPEAADTGLSTVLRGKAGDWLDAGGSLQLDSSMPDGSTYSTRPDWSGDSRLLIRVELLD